MSKVQSIIEEIKGLSLLEASELVKGLEEAFGVSAAAAMMAAAPAAGGGGVCRDGHFVERGKRTCNRVAPVSRFCRKARIDD